MLKSKFSLSRHFEYANEQITYHFWLHSKALRRSEKMHPAWILRPKSTFLTTPILVAGTNSVSSGNIVEESFFDKSFFNCLFTFTMECGAYSNNAMSSRSSFTK
jgi:hypothetical protein